jgi:hypothetical protein
MLQYHPYPPPPDGDHHHHHHGPPSVGGESKGGDDAGGVDSAPTPEDSESGRNLKVWIKPSYTPVNQEVLDRRGRKNAQSRARAARLKLRIVDIENKAPEDRNEEEQRIWGQYENRRDKKNNRSRERALEKKEEIDRILSRPEGQRSKIEKQFLENALGAKKRKNEGDRLRRLRMKAMGIPAKGGRRPGVTARGGPMPPMVWMGPGYYPPPHHAGMIPPPRPPPRGSDGGETPSREPLSPHGGDAEVYINV